MAIGREGAPMMARLMSLSSANTTSSEAKRAAALLATGPGPGGLNPEAAVTPGEPKGCEPA